MKVFKILFLLTCLGFFASCQSDFELDELTTANFEDNIEQAFVFQFANFDENQNWDSGWVIDTKGNICTYELTVKANIQENNQSINSTDLSNFMEICQESIGTVEMEKLIEMFISMCEIQLEDNQINFSMEAEEQSAFYGIFSENYNPSIFDIECETEEEEIGEFPLKPVFKYVVIDPEISRSNYNSNKAKEVKDWLSSINKKV